MKRDALQIFRAALRAADPVEAVRRHLAKIDAGRYRNIFVIGAGKASGRMAQPVEKALGSRITAGLINVKYGDATRLRHIRLNECGHPVPDENGVRGAERIAAIAREAAADDLVLCLISGGASALLPLSAEGIALRDIQRLTEALLACGADIHDINTLRKHVSAIKGGQLARLAYPAAVIALILSDVIGDEVESIGSGPTAPDPSTFADARAILDRYRLWTKVPRSIATHLREARAETPKPGDPVFRKVRNTIVGNNRMAVQAAARQARGLGYRTLVLSTMVDGETREVARVHAAIAKEIRASGQPVRAPACVISGGETTVTLRGSGKGGRNQEFALSAAIEIAGLGDTAILSAGTDGTDGPTDAAGAIATGDTVKRGRAVGLEARRHLDENDAYPFFDAVGGLIRTGPTGTNVMDVRIVLVR